MHDIASLAGGEALPAKTSTATLLPSFLARYASPGTRRAMLVALQRCLRVCGITAPVEAFDWRTLGSEHTGVIRARLAESGCSAASANLSLAALRGILKQAWRLGAISEEARARASDIAPVRGPKVAPGRVVSLEELVDLARACTRDPGPAGARDKAAIALAYGTGARRSELVGLDVEDADLEAGTVRLKRTKGGGCRTCYPPRQAMDAVRVWLEVRGTDPGPLLCRCGQGRKGRAYPERRIAADGLRQLLAKRHRQAGLDGPAPRPHDLRRSFVSGLLDAVGDAGLVQKAVGHADVSTTIRYDLRGEREVEAASRKLPMPAL